MLHLTWRPLTKSITEKLWNRNLSKIKLNTLGPSLKTVSSVIKTWKEKKNTLNKYFKWYKNCRLDLSEILYNYTILHNYDVINKLVTKALYTFLIFNKSVPSFCTWGWIIVLSPLGHCLIFIIRQTKLDLIVNHHPPPPHPTLVIYFKYTSSVCYKISHTKKYF